MENNHFQEVFKKVSNIPFVSIETKEDYMLRLERMGSLLLLFMEHCRLCAIWGETLGYNGVPHKNLLNILNNKWSYSDATSYVDEIRDKFNGASSIGLYLYLSWHLHKEEIDTMGYANLPDPYEPLWRYILRGGEIRYEQGPLIIVTALHMTLPNANDLLIRGIPFIDIENTESLAKADNECSASPQAFLDKYIAKYTFCRREWWY